ncbi:MAG TPA: glycosyltransferase [Solirubrobacterales bacterium]|jgi:glycosyltransferase involved in cell wall biosynthesis/predicted metal-dependent phosphoesterase TrpH|nr:glycosyltransferase [Solirubrobacterales bacterium]
MTSRVDMHCHSTASQLSRLGVQRSLGLPECATPPEEVYELARRRGMDFVTITDHDTIAGCMELDGRPDCFVSEELTARFAGEPQAVHVLCYGITPGDHEWLQAHSGDVEACAAYLHENGIVCALAHPFFNVAAPLTRRHRRVLAELFPIWEVRNGSRAAELNMPAVVYIETRGGTGIGGSDDHAGVDIGRTFTAAPDAQTPEEFLLHLQAGDAEAGGEQGSAAKWTHAAMALATRALAPDAAPSSHLPANSAGDGELSLGPDPAAVLKMAERVIREGAVREGKVAADIGPADARNLLEAWLGGMGLELRGPELIAYLQADGFSHAELYRRARRIHDRRLRAAVDGGVGAVARGDFAGAVNGLFEALLPAVPYAPSTAFLAAEKAKLSGAKPERRRVALIADGIGSMHGVTHTIEQIRERGVPGFEIDVIGTDPGVDRRLPAAAELELPFYEGMRLGVPGLPDLVETLADGHYDLVHVTAPGPAGIAATLLGRITGVPQLASYHTELATYAGMRSSDAGLEALARIGLGAFYGAPGFVLSPSPAADDSLVALGTERERIGRWERGVDLGRFDPAKADPAAFPGEIKVLYAGRLTREKGVDLLAESFLRARRSDPRLHLLLAGGGPEERELRGKLGEGATFLGWLGGEELARAYASADVFLFASSTDTYGQVILEAAASGLPVVAVAEGGPAALVENRHTGLLCRPDPDHLAGALLQLAAAPKLRRQLGSAGAKAARSRSWERSMAQLAAGYRRALDGAVLTPAQTLVQVA